jgi:hypothetical protein
MDPRGVFGAEGAGAVRGKGRTGDGKRIAYINRTGKVVCRVE